MKTLFKLADIPLVIFLVFFLVVALNSCALTQSSAQVETDIGTLMGTNKGSIQVFKGIPYAAPPIGDLRWRPPQAPTQWQGVRSAAEFGPMCAQRDTGSLWFDLTNVSEDCLHLNIWTPDTAPAQPLPVMISVHGGGLLQGTGNTPRQNGIALARRGVVYISFNYRLSTFGFMTHPALAALHPDENQGNYGLQDSAAMLEWVQRNIRQFGGDPNNVTIFGTSGGADIINALMVTPRAAGLFHRAISQSASVGISPIAYRDRRVGFTPSTDRLGQAFVKRANLHESADVAAALHALSTEQVIDTLIASDRFPLVVDGSVLPDQINTLFATGQAHPVAYMTGSNSFEASLGYEIGAKALIPENFAKMVSSEDQDRLYTDLTNERRYEAIFGDIIMAAQSRYLATRVHALGMPVYCYYFSYIAEGRRSIDPGAKHGSDVAFVVGTLESEKDLDFVSEEDQRISALMMDYWVQFAQTGNPNREDLPAWPGFDPVNARLLDISANPVGRERFHVERMKFHMDRGQASFRKALE